MPGWMLAASCGSMTAPLWARTPVQPLTATRAVSARESLTKRMFISSSNLCRESRVGSGLQLSGRASICWASTEAQAFRYSRAAINLMLRHLFPGLTRDRGRQAPLMGAVITVAREPGWYLEGGVPDTIDGRFRMLATISALTMVRLDELGSAGERESALL